VKLPVYKLLSVPPRNNSAPEVESLNENTGDDTCFSATSDWKTGGDLYTEIDWYAIPISPSGGKLSMSKLDE
jgi:hypothetical protein